MTHRLLTTFSFSLLLATTAEAQIFPPFAPPLGAPPVPAANPITPAKAILGKALFWDEQLSSDNTMACGTCHIPASGGVDPRTPIGSVHPGLDGIFGNADDKRSSRGVTHTDAAGMYLPEVAVGFGFDPQVTDRQSMSHIGAAMFPTTCWDGRGAGTFVDPVSGAVLIGTGGALESQSLGPILNSVEMARPGRTWTDVVNKLNSVRPMALGWALTPGLAAATTGVVGYGPLFAAAYGDPAITPQRIAFALATYMRTQHPDQTPFDLGTMTPWQQAGANLFTSNGCISCHTPPFFSDLSFHNVGVRPIVEDAGAGGGRFKTPSLRNVGLRPAFFDNGDASKPTLRSVFDHYATVGIAAPWTPSQKGQVRAFLANGLTDPRVAAELPPFDRPRLNSERSPASIVFGGFATLGAGGFRPAMLAEVPPLVGSIEFKLGLHNAEGGATGVLQRLNPATGSWVNASGPIPLAGPPGIPGTGFTTIPLPIPPMPSLVGTSDSFRWRVFDSGGLCRSGTATVQYL